MDYTWIAISAGNRIFYVDVKDEAGTVVRSEAISVKTYDNIPLSITASVDKSEVETGDTVTFTAKGSGGEGSYTYKFIVYNSDTDTWALLQDFSNNSTFTWTAISAGNRIFYVDVKDEVGTVVRSEAINIITY